MVDELEAKGRKWISIFPLEKKVMEKKISFSASNYQSRDGRDPRYRPPCATYIPFR
jgi:hypothetical protein